MSAVDVMDLVKELPEPEALNLGRMLDDWLAGIVDRKFEAAVEAGAFDAMAAEALREAEVGKTIPLDDVLDDRRVPWVISKIGFASFIQNSTFNIQNCPSRSLSLTGAGASPTSVCFSKLVVRCATG